MHGALFGSRSADSTAGSGRTSAADKTTCIGMETAGGPASYVELLSCLEVLRDAKSIEATDPLAGGDMESGTSRADVTHASRVRNRHPDRGRRRTLWTLRASRAGGRSRRRRPPRGIDGFVGQPASRVLPTRRVL
jgi:hypothetical protein